MKITVTSILVDDQAKALAFYTDVLGFVKKNDVPLGEHRWLTVVSPAAPDGVELALEPDEHPAVKPFKAALVEDGIPFTSPPPPARPGSWHGSATGSSPRRRPALLRRCGPSWSAGRGGPGA
jgi:catechol 2,3-dioxygenase-like lactoylglutathione lyase family enzyme